jgi:pilus assembly protein Flp/PilA
VQFLFFIHFLFINERRFIMKWTHLSKNCSDEKGQGLVEYALILVLVAIVVIAILLQLGPTVGQVYCRIANALQPGSCGVITAVSAERTGGGHSNDVDVTITVSESTSVTVSDSQNASPETTTCNGSCTVTLSGVGANPGTVTVEADEGGIFAANYTARL